MLGPPGTHLKLLTLSGQLHFMLTHPGVPLILLYGAIYLQTCADNVDLSTRKRT